MQPSPFASLILLNQFCSKRIVKPELAKATIGCLLGTAVGDAMGLPYEGLSPQRLHKLAPNIDRYRFLFDKGGDNSFKKKFWITPLRRPLQNCRINPLFSSNLTIFLKPLNNLLRC